MLKNKKGGAAVWILTLISVFTIAIVWIVMTEPYDTVHDKFNADIPAEYQSTMTKMQTVWNNWPIIMILGLILAAFIFTTRDQGDPGYYG